VIAERTVPDIGRNVGGSIPDVERECPGQSVRLPDLDPTPVQCALMAADDLDHESDSRAVPIMWLGLDESPVRPMNQVIAQFDPSSPSPSGEFVVTLGYVVPPIITGTDDEMRRAVDAIEYVPSQTIVRLTMNRERMLNLANALTENVERWDAFKAEEAATDD
jgi:hypothetical protein